MRNSILLLMLLLSGFISAGPIGIKKIDTADVAQSTTICMDCLDWKLVGMCFWLRCSWFECSVEESLKYSHFIPDLVVSSYSGPDSPWEETASWNDVPDGAMSLSESPDDQDSFLNFKNVDIISQPSLLAWNILGDTEYFCNSQLSIPMLPHFLSGLDPNWIDPGIEQLYPQSISGMPTIKGKDVGFLPGFLDPYWAPVYPRCGWGAHPLDPVNGAVAAFRASHILTSRAALHVMVPATGKCGNRCWKPETVKQNDSDENKFQMIYPDMEEDAKMFGWSASKLADGKNVVNQAYMWNLWRRYQCCDAKGQFFLYEISYE